MDSFYELNLGFLLWVVNYIDFFDYIVDELI